MIIEPSNELEYRWPAFLEVGVSVLCYLAEYFLTSVSSAVSICTFIASFTRDTTESLTQWPLSDCTWHQLFEILRFMISPVRSTYKDFLAGFRNETVRVAWACVSLLMSIFRLSWIAFLPFRRASTFWSLYRSAFTYIAPPIPHSSGAHYIFVQIQI
jgi:hypothetical protein